MNSATSRLSDIAAMTLQQALEKQQQAKAAKDRLQNQFEMVMQRIVNQWPQTFPSFSVQNKFIMRQHHHGDLEKFFKYFTEEDVNRYILVTRPRQLAETARDVAYNRGLFHRRKGIFWSIICKTSGRLIGTAGLYTDRLPVEVCYDLHPDYWRKGIMTEAANNIINFTKQQWPFLKAMRAIILRENTASIALLNKLGFSWQATSVNDREHKSKWYDVEIYERELQNN